MHSSLLLDSLQKEGHKLWQILWSEALQYHKRCSWTNKHQNNAFY